jgi:hypothetical protein
MTRVILMVVFMAAALFILKRAIDRARSVFRIDVLQGRLKLTGTIPGRSWSEISEFLKTLPLPRRCHIVGLPAQQRFALTFSGNINEDTRQRIRNFLYLNL